MKRIINKAKQLFNCKNIFCRVEFLVRRFYKFYWRKYAALPILILQIIGQIFLPNIITGFILALWLTIPCGIKYVNIYKWLWIPRQILFVAMSISYFIR